MQDELTIPRCPDRRGPLGTDVQELLRQLAFSVYDRRPLTLIEIEDLFFRLEEILARVDALEKFQGLVRREAEIIRLRPKLRVVECGDAAMGEAR